MGEAMTELSPAQAVLCAYRDLSWTPDEEDNGKYFRFSHKAGMAAALRAAADQVVPCGPKPSANSDFHLMNWTKSLDQYYQRQQTRDELLAIAAELEAK
jgi:hypothetical protein